MNQNRTSDQTNHGIRSEAQTVESRFDCDEQPVTDPVEGSEVGPGSRGMLGLREFR